MNSFTTRHHLPAVFSNTLQFRNYSTEHEPQNDAGSSLQSESSQISSNESGQLTNQSILQERLRPSQIVKELDRYIIGQYEAKRAVAIALRN